MDTTGDLKQSHQASIVPSELISNPIVLAQQGKLKQQVVLAGCMSVVAKQAPPQPDALVLSLQHALHTEQQDEILFEGREGVWNVPGIDNDDGNLWQKQHNDGK